MTTSAVSTVTGTTEDGFEAVADALAAARAAEPGLDAQVVALVDGVRVVDLVVGDGIAADSLVPVYSVGKGAAHLVVALLVQEGVLELGQRVADVWPEFATHGKDTLTLHDLVTHRAGLVGVPEGFTMHELASDEALAARLAGQVPAWPVGKGYGYHAYVVAALTGEVVNRVTGRTLREHYDARIRTPRGLDLYLGLPEGVTDRALDVQAALRTPQEEAARAAGVAPDSLMSLAFNLQTDPPTDIVAVGNDLRVRQLGPASSGAVGSARGVAGLYAAAIGADGGGALLDDASLAAVSALHTPGADLVTGEQDHFGLGFERVGRSYPFLGPNAFGHTGATGSVGFADPASGVALGYVRRRFSRAGNVAPEVEVLARAVTAAAQR